MEILLKFIPVFCLAATMFMAWIAWSLRQLAKTEVSKVDPSHPMMISCFLTGITGTKSPGPGCGR